MNENKIATLNTKKIKARKLNLKKWRWLFLALMKFPCAERRQENTEQDNLPQSPVAKDVTPWDDDENKIFSN